MLCHMRLHLFRLVISGCSTVGQCTRLISEKSVVRLHPSRPGADVKQIGAATWGTPGAVLTNLNGRREPSVTLYRALYADMVEQADALA